MVKTWLKPKQNLLQKTNLTLSPAESAIARRAPRKKPTSTEDDTRLDIKANGLWDRSLSVDLFRGGPAQREQDLQQPE